MKSIFKLILGFIIITTSVTAYLLVKNKEQKSQEKCCIPLPMCGTKSETANDPDAQKGKQIFNANCVACHKLDAVSTGPALRDVAKKYSKLNMELYNYLHGKRDMHLLRQSIEGNGGLCPIFPDLTKEDVASLEAYTH